MWVCVRFSLSVILFFFELDGRRMKKKQRSGVGIQSIRKPASREKTSDSVELCETDVCFMHIQLIGTNV